MKKILFSIILYTTLLSHVNAQDIVINSKVLDAETREVLPNATISIDADKSFIANIDGEFCIETSPTDELTISYIGYKPVHVKAEDVGSAIELSPYVIELSETKVLSLKSILKRVVSAIETEIKIYKKQESNFYYRQTSQNNGECCEYIESFLNGYSELALRQPSIITGRYGALGNTDEKEYSHPMNYYMLSCVSPYARTLNKKVIIYPLIPNYERLYKVDYEILRDKTNGSSIYKIMFTPRPEIKNAIVKGYIFVDADSYRLLKYEGDILNEHIVYKNGNRYAANISFSVNYSHRNNFTEIQNVTVQAAYSEEGISATISSTLVNVGKKYYNGKKKLGDFSDLKQKINSTGYDTQFWNDNTIIKRTPMEEQVVKMFEKDNVFSNITQ
ncbi:MAG: carboxypeptidase-like regulatory domain-containing protein [Prevotella sp.]|nr:carboxypeptidase-like regulatory domain-containing protein [Prevotella sp.]